MYWCSAVIRKNKVYVGTHVCIWSYVSRSPATFPPCCDKDTAWSKPNIRNCLLVWMEKSGISPPHIHCVCVPPPPPPPRLRRRGCAPDRAESVSHVNILFSRYTLPSVKRWQSYSQQGQLLQKCPQNKQLCCHKTLDHRQPITRQQSGGFVWHRPRGISRCITRKQRLYKHAEVHTPPRAAVNNTLKSVRQLLSIVIQSGFEYTSTMARLHRNSFDVISLFTRLTADMHITTRHGMTHLSIVCCYVMPDE